MEILERYLERKRQEIELLNGCLKKPLVIGLPTSVADVIEQKFQIAAALKAEHALMDWSHTETAWSNPSGLRSGPFTFHYDYQRADLKVDGPPFYEISAAAETIYTSSGMAAISALLMSLDRIYSDANLSILPGSYAETLEVIESYLARVRPVYLKRTLDERALVSGRRQALLLDSCTPAAAFEATLATEQPNLDLIIFDTTCFSASSGRIRRTLSWANNLNIPIILVRSHTKLDSLGMEYGRLGSLVFIIPEGLARKQRERFESLSKEVQNAIRLFGGAALPAHFPPYVGAPSYKLLTSSRIAAIIRNARRTSRFFASFLPAAGAELHSAQRVIRAAHTPHRT